MTNGNQSYSSPEIYQSPENSDQTRQEDELTRGLENVKNDSQNPYNGGEPIHPDELQRPTRSEQLEADKETQPGDRELLRNQKEIIEDARRTLGELDTVASESDSTAHTTELNGWLATALNEAEQARQNPPVDQDHRLVADRLQVISELTEQSKELVETYKNFESKFKQAADTFSKDGKEALDDFERAIEAGDADELASKSANALDRLRQDSRENEKVKDGFNTEINAIQTKLDGLSSRYFAPTERLAERQFGENQQAEIGPETALAAEQQESSDLMHGVTEHRSQTSDQINKLNSEMSQTIEGQEHIMKQVEEVVFQGRRYEENGDETSRRRTKAERLGNPQ